MSLTIKQKYSGKILQELTLHNENDVENMLCVADNLYKNHYLAKYERIKVLEKLKILLQQHSGEFTRLIADEGGKPLKDAKVEVIRAIDGIRIALAAVQNIKGVEVPMELTEASQNNIAFTTMEPIGIVIAISAFNHPLNLIIHQVVPAIATGCPIIIKPAANTPLCALLFAKLVMKTGLKNGYLQVALVDNYLAEKLVTDKRIAFFSFIGSSKVGWMLKAKLAKGVRCALEHGGVAPVIFDNYNDVNGFVTGLVKAAFYHAGQVCVSAQKVFINKNQAKKIAIKIANEANKLIIGDAADEKTDVGPLISSTEVDRVEKIVNEAIAEGAELITGGKRIGNVCYEPTVLLNPHKNSKVSITEIFGPVICIYSYNDINNAIAIANSLDVAFQASVWTDDIKSAIKYTKKIQASAVMINNHTTFRVDWMPFAGRKHSGYGIGGISYTMHDMLEHKMILINYS